MARLSTFQLIGYMGHRLFVLDRVEDQSVMYYCALDLTACSMWGEYSLLFLYHEQGNEYSHVESSSTFSKLYEKVMKRFQNPANITAAAVRQRIGRIPELTTEEKLIISDFAEDYIKH